MIRQLEAASRVKPQPLLGVSRPPAFRQRLPSKFLVEGPGWGVALGRAAHSQEIRQADRQNARQIMVETPERWLSGLPWAIREGFTEEVAFALLCLTWPVLIHKTSSHKEPGMII